MSIEMQNRIKMLLKMVANTDPDDVDCGSVYAIMDEAAELVAAGADLSAAMPDIHKHLSGCGMCKAEFIALQKILSGPELEESN